MTVYLDVKGNWSNTVHYSTQLLGICVRIHWFYSASLRKLVSYCSSFILKFISRTHLILCIEFS